MYTIFYMAAMRQVPVRMTEKLRSAAIRMARREKISFGEFVRQAVDYRIVAAKTAAKNLAWNQNRTTN